VSSDIINAEKAVIIAKGFLDKAGYAYYFIEEVKRDGENWIVQASTLANKVVMKISATGEVFELTPIK
jgi:hypothetical protein